MPKYQVILVNTALTIDAVDLKIDSDHRLNVYGKDDVSGETRLVLQANARHWICWMLVNEAPSVVPATMIQVPPAPFGRRN